MAEPDRILIVDDDPDVARLVEYLETEGRPVATARTAAEALHRLGDAPVAVVLLGLAPRDPDAARLLAEARRRDPSTETILLASPGALDGAVEAAGDVLATCLVKPVALPRLGAMTRRALERRAMARPDEGRLGPGLQERLEEREALLAVARATASTLDVQEALRRVCRELTLLVGADTGSVYLHDPASDQLRPYAGYHVPRELLATLLATPLPLREQSFHLPIWAARRPVMSDDVAADGRFAHEAFRLFRHQSGLLVPLVLDEEVAGAFYLVWWTERRRLTDRELSLVDTVTDQVAGLLRNARLHEQTARERRRLDVLYDLSRRLAAVHDTEALLALLVEEARALMGGEGAGIRLLEGEDLVVGARTESAALLMARPRIKVGESLSGRVVATGEPIVVEDVHEDPRFDPVSKRGARERDFHGFLGVPLRMQDQVIGSLNIYTKERRRFTADEISLLSALADQASLAIHKARLLREAEEGRHLIDRLYRVAVSMQSSLEQSERLEAFVRGIQEAIGLDRVSVLLVTPDGGSLELCAAVGDKGAPPPAMLPRSPASGPLYQAVEKQRVISVLDDRDLETVLPLAAAYRNHPYFRSRRFVVAPLVVGDRVIGVAIADNKHSRRPISPAAIEPFALLCQQLAIALEEARLYTESRARGREAIRISAGLTLLNRASRELHRTLDIEPMLDQALGELGRAFGADSVRLNLLPLRGGAGRSFGRWASDAHGRAVTVRATGGITRTLRETGQPLVLPDISARPDLVHPAHFEHGVRSIAAFPVTAQGQVIGGLLLYYTTPQAFPEREVQLLTAYSDQLATALENARLYAETRAQQARLAQIFDSTSDGIMLVNGERRVEAANQRVADLLGIEGGAVLGREISGLLAECQAAPDDAERIVSALDAASALPEASGDLGVGTRVVHWGCRPTRDAAGGAVGSTLTFQDVTQEREVGRMKTEFVSFVTHQLRTPLGGIKWMLELAASEPDLPADVASYVQDARASADRLIGLVNNLLNISRLERGRLVVTPREVELHELTRRALEEMAVLAREKKHRISLTAAGDVPPVLADPQLLREVIVNLLSNAVKYTPPGGDISIRIGRDDDSVCWAVQDTGIGVPAQSRATVFEKFHRAENVVTLETEGTGLGLYLVRLIVEQLGGRVWCESEEGRGSTFTFTLPLGSDDHGTH